MSCAVPHAKTELKPPVIPKQHVLENFAKQLDDHENKFGTTIDDRSKYLEAPWPKNVLQHVLSAYQQRTSFIGSLTRSRTSLNLITTPTDRRKSVSPPKWQQGSKSLAASANSTTKRNRITKADRHGSTTNLRLVSEKISGFSVFRPDDYMRRDPIMAYGSEVSGNSSRRSSGDVLESRGVGRSKTRDKRSPKSNAKLNRQSMSEQLFKKLNTEGETKMKRSISQQSLKQDISMEAVVIDVPYDSRYNTMKSNSTFGSSSLSDVDDSKSFSRWGPVRGSNSYSNAGDVPVSQLSTLNLRASLKADKDEDTAV